MSNSKAYQLVWGSHPTSDDDDDDYPKLLPMDGVGLHCVCVFVCGCVYVSVCKIVYLCIINI